MQMTSILGAFSRALKNVFKPVTSSLGQASGQVGTVYGEFGPQRTLFRPANNAQFSQVVTRSPVLHLERTITTLVKQGLFQGNFSAQQSNSLFAHLLPSKLFSFAAGALDRLRVDLKVLPKNWQQNPYEVERAPLRERPRDVKPVRLTPLGMR